MLADLGEAKSTEHGGEAVGLVLIRGKLDELHPLDPDTVGHLRHIDLHCRLGTPHLIHEIDD